MEKVFEIYIKTTPERLWEAITEPDLRAKYTFGVRVESDWTPGSPYNGGSQAASGLIFGGENIEVDSWPVMTKEEVAVELIAHVAKTVSPSS